MPVYSVDDDQITVGEFLRKPSTSPSIQNADTRIRELINCHGIIHYTRSGIRAEITAESDQAEKGDFLVLADVCATGESQTIVAAFNPSDYAFADPRDRPTNNPFGFNAKKYMDRRPETRTVDFTNTINSLDAVLRTIVSGSQIATPIKDVVIVTHAGEGGFLFMKLRNNSPHRQISYYDLYAYLNDQNRPQMTSRQIRNNANIYIRGCNIGKEPRYLDLVKRLFGNNVKVTAPKHLDNFNYFRSGSTKHRYEHLSYCFTVFNKIALSNKQQVVDAFNNHSPSFEDIFINRITNALFNTWVPQNINNNSEVVHPCSNPIDNALTVTREFRHRFDNNLYNFDVSLDSNPLSVNLRIDILKDSLRQGDTMKSSHNFPEYHQFGYSSLDEFVDNLNWHFNWDNNTNTLHCRGTRHLYQLRIPITDGNNNLFLNVFLDTGNKQYEHQQIVETDSRFFGSV